MSVQTQHKSLHCPFPAVQEELSAVDSFVRLACMAFSCTDAAFISSVERMAHNAFSLILRNNCENATCSSIIVECTKSEDGVVLSLFDQGNSCNSSQTELLADVITFTPKNSKALWNQLSLFKRYNKIV